MLANSLYVAGAREVPPGAPGGRPEPVRSHRRLLGAAVGYLLALGLTVLVFLGTRGGQRLDVGLALRASRYGGQPGRDALSGPARALLSAVGDPVLWAVLLAAVLVLGALGGRLWAGVAGVCATLCSVAVATILKLAVPRPQLGVDGSTAHNSFPSGHVAAAAGVLLAFLLVSPARVRCWLAGPGAAGVAAVASATVVLGWHRFSDVAGAVLLASAMCCLATAALARWHGAAAAGAGRWGAGRSGTGRWGTGRSGTGRWGAGRESGGRWGAGRRELRCGGGLGGVAGLLAVTGPLILGVAAAARYPAPGPAVAVLMVSGFTGLWTASMLSVLNPIDGRFCYTAVTRGGPDRKAPVGP
jgi:membrane-associated phospholipid phosphatase